jgi:hypothetical protein
MDAGAEIEQSTDRSDGLILQTARVADAGRSEAAAQALQIPAAKIHVLGLGALQIRLGPKWNKLSSYVHKLFESAIVRAQGPSDHFVRLDDLSYAVTFHRLSLAEADLACLAIAKEICQLLFGENIDEISVRNLVGEIASSKIHDAENLGTVIEEALEESGKETVVTQSVERVPPEPFVWSPSDAPKPSEVRLGKIEAAHALLESIGLQAGFLPIWDLKTDQSSTMFLLPYWGANGIVNMSGGLALGSLAEEVRVQVEIALLHAASGFAERLHSEKKVCAVGVGVSHRSLSVLHSRIRYITALSKIKTFTECPVLLKIERVPDGAPQARLAELIAMLKAPNVRCMIEFERADLIPAVDVRLGAIGLGGVLPAGAGFDVARRMAENLARRTQPLKMFAFMNGLDAVPSVDAARLSNIRFGSGEALGIRYASGIGEVPNFPLSRPYWEHP